MNVAIKIMQGISAMLNSVIAAYEIVAIWTAYCTEDDLSAFLGESLKMKELCHPNVMNLLGVSLDAVPTPYIVLPFMENGDLLSYIKKRRESLLVTECDDIDKVHVHLITHLVLTSRFAINCLCPLSQVPSYVAQTTTLVLCKPMQPCTASITNYKSCLYTCICPMGVLGTSIGQLMANLDITHI